MAEMERMELERADKMSLKEALEQMKQENSKDFESDTDKVDDVQNNPII
ncbi:unknown [Clostridium sp. CAG:306]|nr:unknown [Clostridium sp. CAG:306]